jgi:16S rRNA (guanine(966)-N(2))-methyltransferase RsmD
VRIVAGSARGRRLRAPRGRAIRPTTDRVKEAVFSIVASREGCEGVAVLDLFAGTGALGIEALSRGATEAVFVEQSRAAAETIRANLTTTGFEAEVMTMPVARAIARLAGVGRRFGGVFLDPPYDRGWIDRTLALLDESGVLADGAWVVVEHGRNEQPAPRHGALVQRLQRCYGDTSIALYAVERAPEKTHGHG